MTGLIWACEKNNFDMAKLLLLNDASVGNNKSGLSELLLACENNNLELV